MISNIEKLPIQIPNNINFKLFEGKDFKILRINNNLIFKQFKLPLTTLIKLDNNKLYITDENMGGTIRTLINNWIIGLSKYFFMIFIIQEIGGKVLLNQKKLILYIGNSVPTELEIPENIEIKIKGTNTILAKSYSKSDLSLFINKIKLLKK